MYVTNNKEPWTLNLEHPYSDTSGGGGDKSMLSTEATQKSWNDKVWAQK